jgi:hypothetical protein
VSLHWRCEERFGLPFALCIRSRLSSQGRMGLMLSVCLLSFFPIGPVSVMIVNTRAPLTIRHLWPLLFVEPRGFFEHLSVDVQDKRLLCG